MRVIAQRPHDVPHREPLQLTVGERVSVGERSPQWPAFVFVSCSHGEGWVPSRLLSAESGEATVDVAYDTAELPVTPGQEVVVLQRDDESGWWWCRADGGAEGWVPVSALVD